MILRLPLLLLLPILLLSASLLAEQPVSEKLIGTWEQDGYGRLLQVDRETLTIYHHCAESCLPGEAFTADEFNRQFEVAEVTETRLKLRMGINRYTFRRIKELPNHCSLPPPALRDDPLYNFNILWQTFREQYAYFKEREIDWEEIGNRYRSCLTRESTPLQLYLTIEAMVGELGDGHSFVSLPDELSGAYQMYQDSVLNARLAAKPGSKKKRLKINIDRTLKALIEYYVDDLNTYNNGAVNWGMINQEIALLQINGMDETANYDPTGRKKNARFEKQYAQVAEKSENVSADEVAGAHYVMNKVMNDLSSAEACIIDLRFNGGGQDEVALAFLSYFTVHEQEVFSKKAWLNPGFTPSNTVKLAPAAQKFKGKVYVLTSTFTASAAELFLLASLTAMPDAVRIGSHSEGIFSDVLEKRLPNGWYYGLSNEVYLSPEGESFEKEGIAPHHEIPYKESKFWFLHQLKEGLPNGDEAVNRAVQLFNDSNTP